MTDHLPECQASHVECELSLCNCACICDYLRACEQRVADEIWGAIREGSQYLSGFEGGLDAAEAAVVARWKHTDKDWTGRYVVDEALAAIRALKEKK